MFPMESGTLRAGQSHTIRHTPSQFPDEAISKVGSPPMLVGVPWALHESRTPPVLFTTEPQIGRGI